MAGIENDLKRVSHLLNSDRTAHGSVSKIAKRKLTRALDYLLILTNEKRVSTHYTGRSYRFKIAFVTLTLPSKQAHSDKEIKNKCLNQFLIELKKNYHTKNYIWRAEKQKNGNLHFHIIVDKFIPHQELRDRWNRIINKLGYIDRYREEQQNWHKDGFRVKEYLTKTWPVKKQKEAYERNQRINWNSPNSTDIHSIQKIRNIKDYMAKYLTKDEIKERSQAEDEPDIAEQTGRIWGCNHELNNIKGAQVIMDTALQDEIELIESVKESYVYRDTYFSVIYFDIRLLSAYPQVKLFQLFSKYLLERFGKNLQAEIAA